MAGSPEDASSPEERTILEARRRSNASSSSGSSSSSSDDDEQSEAVAESPGGLDGGAPPENPTVHDTSSGIGNAQEQQDQHKESNADEAGKPNLGSDLVSMLMVAGGVAVAIAAAFLVNKKR